MSAFRVTTIATGLIAALLAHQAAWSAEPAKKPTRPVQVAKAQTAPVNQANDKAAALAEPEGAKAKSIDRPSDKPAEAAAEPAATFVIAPVVVLFLFAQRYLIQGVARTGIRG